MKLSCEIVQDLLPLYADEVCSQQSRLAVGEHLRECERCRKLVESTANLPDLEVQPEQPVAEKAVAKSFRKIRRRWCVSLLALLLLIPVCCGIWYLSQNGGPHMLYFADMFVSYLQDEDYERAFEFVYTDGLKEEWLQEWFTEAELVDFYDAAPAKFCEMAAELSEAGGIEAYEYIGCRLEGYDQYNGGDIYEYLYSVTVAGEEHSLSISVSDKGVCAFGCEGSFLTDPLARFGMWTEYLWQDYSGCYFDPESGQYVYYENEQ